MPRDPLPFPEDRRPMARPRPAPRRRAAWFAVSALLHLAVLALLLVSPRPESQDGDAQPSYDVVFAEPAPDQPVPDAGTDTPAPPVPPDPDAQPGARPPTPPPEPTPPEPTPEPEPAPPEPAPPEPAPPEPVQPEPAPLQPAPPAPAPPRPRAPPSVRLAEPDLPEPMQLPPPVPIPAAPPPPPRPAAPPRPRPRQQQADRFPAPIDLNFGPAAPGRPAPGSVASRALDLSLGPARPGSLRAESSDLRSPNASADLMAALQAWWRRHRYYPEQARQAGEDGAVGIRLRVDRYGKVASVEMQSRSGSQWLDMAALGAFRGAQLVVPSNAGETVSVDLTINYVLIRR